MDRKTLAEYKRRLKIREDRRAYVRREAGFTDVAPDYGIGTPRSMKLTPMGFKRTMSKAGRIVPSQSKKPSRRKR